MPEPFNSRLVAFVTESNRIEGIVREPSSEELAAHTKFLFLPSVKIGDLEAFVASVQPGAVLRSEPGMDVLIGLNLPPVGGPAIPVALGHLLASVRSGSAYAIHQRYEHLHPFMDGNGRSGRALWLWMMKHASARDFDRAMSLGFLHVWYYQSLEEARLAK